MDTSELPTKNNLIRLQGKIKVSKQGHELLEKKKIILNMEKSKYQNKKEALEKETEKLYEYAYNKLKKAYMTMEISDIKEISKNNTSNDFVDIKHISIMGVEIPSIIYSKGDIKPSIYKSTIELDEAIKAFVQLKEKMIELAELDNIIIKLNNNIKKVQKRSNALKEIIIPKDEKLEKQIKNILEEREREEFTRLKVIKKISDFNMI